MYVLLASYITMHNHIFTPCPQDGWSAMMVATKNGHARVVRYLVEHGSNAYYQKHVRPSFTKYINASYFYRME